MLLERNLYENDFAVNINIATIKEIPIHYHEDLEVLFILKGEIRLKSGCHEHLLQEGEIFFNRELITHALYRTKRENVVAVINVSNRFFAKHLPDWEKGRYQIYPVDRYHPHLCELRRILLQLLLLYVQKAEREHWEPDCIAVCTEFLNYVQHNFNFFLSSQKQELKESNGAATTQKVNRMINYIYENYAQRITLDDLAEREQLSVYYISHLIREYMAMSFRELLSLVRVEQSELSLLGTDKKISAIARLVGFSTTAYYEKFFEKWFGRSVREHREQFLPLIWSLERPVEQTLLPVEYVRSMIQQHLSLEKVGVRNVPARSRRLLVESAPEREAGVILRHQFEINMTLDDFHVMGYDLFNHLRRLACERIIIGTDGSEDTQSLSFLRARLIERGYSVAVGPQPTLREAASSGWDSIAAAIYVLHTGFPNGTMRQVCLRDQGSGSILKGQPALFTSNMLPKPMYYAVQILSKLQGKLVDWGEHHAIVKLKGAEGSYFVLACHYDQKVMRLCQEPFVLQDVMHVIQEFDDTMSIHFSLEVPEGKYLISQYTLDEQSSILGLLSKIDVTDRFHVNEIDSMEQFTRPKPDIHSETVDSVLELELLLTGACIQYVYIQTMEV